MSSFENQLVEHSRLLIDVFNLPEWMELFCSLHLRRLFLQLDFSSELISWRSNGQKIMHLKKIIY